jgi:hypothetical protein
MAPLRSTQLPLPLDPVPSEPYPLALNTPIIQPTQVWNTVDQRTQTRIRLIWIRILTEVTDGHQ